MGAHRLLEAEGSLRIADDERVERVRDTTRRRYMAMTRAGQRLVLTQPTPVSLQTYVTLSGAAGAVEGSFWASP